MLEKQLDLKNQKSFTREQKRREQIFIFFVQGGATVAAWDAADSTPTERIATS